MSERDKYITEAMGEFYHTPSNIPTICVCGMSYYQNDHLTDFSTWEGFGKLWEWSQEQGWWESFVFCNWRTSLSLHEYIGEWVNPDGFADAVYDFLKEVKDE